MEKEQPIIEKKKHMKKSLETRSKHGPQSMESSPEKNISVHVEYDRELYEHHIHNVDEKPEQPKQREETPVKVSKITREVNDDSQASQQPQTPVRAKTFYGQPAKTEELPKEDKLQQDRPKMTRSKTTVEKPKSKACNLM
jgi:hypothetical protein